MSTPFVYELFEEHGVYSNLINPIGEKTNLERINKMPVIIYMDIHGTQNKGSIRGTVVACWTAGQEVERSILRQGHDL